MPPHALVCDVMADVAMDGTGATSVIGSVGGSLMVVLGSLLHAIFFVLAEKLLNPSGRGRTAVAAAEIPRPRAASGGDGSRGSRSDRSLRARKGRLTPTQLSGMLGAVELLLLLGYNGALLRVGGIEKQMCVPFAFDVPVFLLIYYLFMLFSPHPPVHRVRATPIARAGASMHFVGALYGALVVVNAVHAASFFALLHRLGSVGAALMKAFQTLLVVGIAATVLCRYDASQCLDGPRAISVLFVLAGLMVYGGVVCSNPPTSGDLDSKA